MRTPIKQEDPPAEAKEPAVLTTTEAVAARRQNSEAHLNEVLKLRPNEEKQAYAERVKSSLQSFRQDPYTPYVCRLKVYLVSVLINLQLEMHTQDAELALKPENRDKRIRLVGSCLQDAWTKINKILAVKQDDENRDVLVEMGEAIRSFFQQMMAGIREKGDIVEGVSAVCGSERSIKKFENESA